VTAATSALYVGRVMHRRLRPRAHSLAYRVFWMLLDLDEIDDLGRSLKLFSVGRWNLFSFRAADYGDSSGRPLRAQVAEALEEAGISGADGPVRLLTMPRILGYAFNPFSVFFCHRRDGSLAGTVYEVHNTFGEVHRYVMPADGEAAPVRQSVDKAFHVSPFLGLAMDYAFRVDPPDDRVAVAIRASDRDGAILLASLSGTREPLTDGALLRVFLTHPLLTLKVTAAIHWHALRLVLKRIGIVRHPGPAAEAITAGRLERSGNARPMAERGTVASVG
jgi:DUF1365 family protein